MAVDKENGKKIFEELSVKVLSAIRSGNSAIVQALLQEVQELLKGQYHPLYIAFIDFLDGFQKRKDFPIEDLKERMYACIKTFQRFRFYEMVARCRVTLALSYMYTFKKYGESLEELIKAELILEKNSIANSITFSECLLTKGNIYYLMQEYDQCTEVLLDYLALPNFQDLPPSGKYISHVNLSRNYALKGDYDSCATYLEKAEQFFPEYNHTNNKAALYVRRSQLHRVRGEWDLAIETLKSGLDFYESTEHFLRRGEFNLELGNLFLMKENPYQNNELAISYFQKASQIGAEHDLMHFQSAVLVRISQAAIDVEDWKSAFEHFSKAKDLEYEIHSLELKKYIKKIEVMSLAEKQDLAKQGKPAYERRIVNEVVSLREENSNLRTKVISYEKILSELQLEIDKLNVNGEIKGRLLEHLYDAVGQGHSKNISIDDYLKECDKLFPTLSNNALIRYETLTKTEMKILKLIRLGLNTNTMASLFGLTVKNIENHRLRMRKKMNLESKQSLVAAIEAIPLN